MSVEAMSWAMNVVTGSVSHKAVLLNLADRAGFDWSCWPSQATIARQTELSERTVRRLLADLEERGFITRAHRGSPGGGRSSDLITLTGQIDRNGLPAIDDRVTGHLEQGYRPPMSGEPPVEPSEEPKNPPTPQGGAIEMVGRATFDDAFEHWWGRYPRKAGKPAAKKALRVALKKATPEQIGSGLLAWIRYWDAKNEPQFVPYPATWLNQERWNDATPPLAKPKIKTNAGVDILRQIREAEGR